MSDPCVLWPLGPLRSKVQGRQLVPRRIPEVPLQGLCVIPWLTCHTTYAYPVSRPFLFSCFAGCIDRGLENSFVARVPRTAEVCPQPGRLKSAVEAPRAGFEVRYKSGARPWLASYAQTLALLVC